VKVYGGAQDILASMAAFRGAIVEAGILLEKE
jgi:hypothetical protein